MEKIIKTYKRLPIVTKWFYVDGRKRIGFDVCGKYRIIGVEFLYNCYQWFLQRDEETYTVNEFGYYYIVKYLLNGGEVNTDEEMTEVVNHFNTLPFDSIWSELEVDVIESGRKWSIEDKRVLKDDGLIDSRGERVVIIPNKLTIERIGYEAYKGKA